MEKSLELKRKEKRANWRDVNKEDWRGLGEAQR